MRQKSLGRYVGLLGAALLVAAPAASARADLLLGFNNGLTGWTVSDSSLVSVTGGLATIQESATANEIDLYADFHIPTDALRISFTLNSVNPDADTTNPPDAFGASLLNPTTGNSLVSPVNPTTDSYYIRDIVTGVSSGQAASGVTTSPTADALPLHVTLDLAGLTGQDARILFRLIAGGDLSDSSLVISNVVVETLNTSPIPEPSSLVLLGTGLCTALGWRSVARSRRGRGLGR